MAMEEQQFLEIARAVADPKRFEILSRIAAAGELACAHLTCDLGITPATISHHVKALTEAGLVDGRKEGRFFFYTLRANVWTAYLRDLARRVPARKS